MGAQSLSKPHPQRSWSLVTRELGPPEEAAGWGPRREPPSVPTQPLRWAGGAFASLYPHSPAAPVCPHLLGRRTSGPLDYGPARRRALRSGCGGPHGLVVQTFLAFSAVRDAGRSAAAPEARSATRPDAPLLLTTAR